MKKLIAALVGISVIATPAFAQVRPQDCRPVLPVVDKLAAAVPQDVVAQPAAPVAMAARRGFFGLPLLLPLLALAGGAAALTGNGGGGGNGQPVSP